MSSDKQPKTGLGEYVAVVLLAVPVLGVLMGGVYSIPAGFVTKNREPYFTGCLMIGLLATTFGLGWLAHVPMPYLIGVWVIGVALLFAQRAAYAGDLGGNLERYGMVHAMTLALTGFVIAANRARLLPKL